MKPDYCFLCARNGACHNVDITALTLDNQSRVVHCRAFSGPPGKIAAFLVRLLYKLIFPSKRLMRYMEVGPVVPPAQARTLAQVAQHQREIQSALHNLAGAYTRLLSAKDCTIAALHEENQTLRFLAARQYEKPPSKKGGRPQ